MHVTAIEGIVENGSVRLRDGASLPEKTRVYVIVAESPEGTTAPTRIRTPHLAHPEQAKDFRKQVMEVQANAKL